jgi:hypothetical protein
MRIKTGDEENDDLQLISGVSVSTLEGLITLCVPFTNRIHGRHGAVDIAQMRVQDAVEATVEVVMKCIVLSICVSSVLPVGYMRKFDGTIRKSCELRRYVLAAVIGTCMDLKLKVGAGSDCSVEHCRSFRATMDVPVINK